MNRNEKGYFKKMYADKGMGRENQYMELFELIDAQKTYDETSLTAYFQQTGIFRQLSVAKNYLTTMILKGLRAYYSKTSVNVELNERMMNIEILFHRELYPVVEKEIRKVESMIDEHGAFHRFPELARWKKNLLDKIADQRLIAELRQDIHTKELEMIERTRVFAEISNLTFQFLALNLKIGPVRSIDQQKDYQKIMDHPILKDESELNSLSARQYYHNIHSMYYEAIRDFDNFHYHTDRFVNLLEAHPGHIQRNPTVYLISCFNRLLSLIRLKDHEGYEAAMRHFQNIEQKWGNHLPADLKRDMWMYKANAEMWALMFKGSFENMVKLGENIEDRTDTQLFVYPFSVLYSEAVYFTTYAAFAMGDFKKAVRKLNRIVNNTLREQREDIACYAMILNMMCHYELGNLDLVESLLRSTYRFMVKMQKIHGFEKTLISFFRRLMKQSNPADLKDFMQQFRDELLVVEQDSYERTTFEYLDLISWLSAHIEKRPFKEIALERLNR